MLHIRRVGVGESLFRGLVADCACEVIRLRLFCFFWCCDLNSERLKGEGN